MVAVCLDMTEIMLKVVLNTIQSIYVSFNPLSDGKILDLSKLKEIAVDILKCIESEKQVSYRVENIVRKGEIACCKHFLFFSQYFLQL